jgi:hypothetical protein
LGKLPKGTPVEDPAVEKAVRNLLMTEDFSLVSNKHLQRVGRTVSRYRAVGDGFTLTPGSFKLRHLTGGPSGGEV